MTIPGKNRTIYHISPVRLWLLPAPMLIAAAVLLVVACLSDKRERAACLVFAVVPLAITAFFFPLVYYPRLELSAEGIKLRQVGYTLETTWDNVAQLHDARSGEGLILHRPMDCRGASFLGAFRNSSYRHMRFYGDLQSRLLGERRYIPIEAFAYWLKHGQLRDELARHAPTIGVGP